MTLAFVHSAWIAQQGATDLRISAASTSIGTKERQFTIDSRTGNPFPKGGTTPIALIDRLCAPIRVNRVAETDTSPLTAPQMVRSAQSSSTA